MWRPQVGGGGLSLASPSGAGTVLEGTAGLQTIEGDWRVLAAQAPDETAFLGYGFASAAARYHEERGRRVLIARACAADGATCLLPVAVSRVGGVKVAHALGDPLAQYGDALAPAGTDPAIVEAALAALTARRDIDVLAFRRVRDGSALQAGLARIGAAATAVGEAPFGALDGAAKPSAKRKREQARLRRRLADFGEVRFEARRGAAALPLLREAFAMKAARLAEAGHASPVIGDPAALLAFERAALDPLDGGSVAAFRLLAGDRVAAFEVGVVRGRRYHAYLGVTDALFALASPGRLVMEDVLGWCRDEGLATIDLLPPGDAYKRQWASAATPVRDYVVSTSLVGALYAGPWLKTARPLLREALRRLPPALRRRAGQAALKVAG